MGSQEAHRTIKLLLANLYHESVRELGALGVARDPARARDETRATRKASRTT